MKLKQLAESLNIVIERYGLKFCTFLFVLSLLLLSLCWLDSKTSIYSTKYEINYTCDIVNGLGDKTSQILNNVKYEKNFIELKDKYKWMNLKLVEKHFKFRGDFMRYEIYKFVLWSLFITNSISFVGIMSIYLCRKYRHDYVVKGLTKLIKNHKNTE